MSNIEIKLNLLKLDNAFVTRIKGKTSEKLCVCIPVADNDIYLCQGSPVNQLQGAYLNITAWERRSVSQYGDTHNIKQSFSREYRERVGELVLKGKPYLGNGKERNTNQMQDNSNNNNGEVPY